MEKIINDYALVTYMQEGRGKVQMVQIKVTPSTLILVFPNF